MSTHRKGRPAHQNSTAFKHNPNSRKTALIARIPNEGLCHRCHDIIEWRKKYRKYKPLTTPRKCHSCQQKTVRFAYHHLCTPCSQQKKICPKCMQNKEIIQTVSAALTDENIMAMLNDSGMRERRRRLIIREWEGRGRSDEEIKAMINKYAAEAMEKDEEDFDDFDDDEEEDGEEEEEEEEDEKEEGKSAEMERNHNNQ